MKRIIFTAILVLSTFVSQAQLSWTVRVGANVSGIENNDSKMKLGLKVGAGIDYSFSQLFSLRSMLYYTTRGASLDNVKFGVFPDRAVKLNYLQIPVLASFHFPVTDRFSIVANAGPYVAYRVSKSPSDAAVKYRMFDAGIGGGLDFVIRKFVVGIEAEYGLSSLSKGAGPKLHNINYSLMLGYTF